MSNIAAIKKNEILEHGKDQLVSVLQSSLYTGAKPESVLMVLDYCKAAGFDPMQKPVHIVPMSVKNPISGNYEWRDVIMPGIGMYRIQADRSGTLAGITPPEFGPLIKGEFRDKNGNNVPVEYPEWCKVTVKKLIGGTHIVEFSSIEYWIENYATAGRDTDAPNAMWKKRPRGQLAKCAEAQALRKAFPEIGQQPTAEEMEGKVIDSYAETVTDNNATIEPETVYYPEEQFNQNIDKWLSVIESGKKTADEIIVMVESKGKLTEEQKKRIKGE